MSTQDWMMGCYFSSSQLCESISVCILGCIGGWCWYEISRGMQVFPSEPTLAPESHPNGWECIPLIDPFISCNGGFGTKINIEVFR